MWQVAETRSENLSLLLPFGKILLQLAEKELFRDKLHVYSSTCKLHVLPYICNKRALYDTTLLRGMHASCMNLLFVLSHVRGLWNLGIQK